MKRNFLIFAGIFAFCAIFLASCSDLVNDLEGTKTVKTGDTYKPAEVTSVPAETVAERTATVTIGSTEYTLNFDGTGKSGTVKKSDGTAAGTFTYDSEVLKMNIDGANETYLRNVNGTYYLLDVNRLENSSGSGLVGKWVWKNGTPSDFYDYYYFYANGIFQNPKYEANGYTGVTWKATEGMVTLYDEDGNVCKEANGVPSVCIYDGTYLYPKCYLLTLGESGTSGSGGNGNSESGGTGVGSGSTGGTGNETDSSRITGSVMISEDGILHGSVSLKKTTGIAAGETVTVTITPDEGYSLGSLSVTDENGSTVETTEVTAGTTYTFIMPESPVTISARFEKLTLAYIGTKAPTEAKEVGDIVFNDGSATPYTSDLILTAEQKAKAVAVIFYAGTEEPTVGSNENILGKKTLGVGLKNTQGETTKTFAWAKKDTTGYETKFTSIQCDQSKTPPQEDIIYYKYIASYIGATYTYYITGDFDGSDNWAEICKMDSMAAANAEENYPAFNWVNNYAAENSLFGEFADGWYLPTAVELRILHHDEIGIVNAALKVAGGMTINQKWPYFYLSSTQSAKNNGVLCHYSDTDRIDNSALQETNKDNAWYVRAIRAF